jgi:hypothetical protein
MIDKSLPVGETFVYDGVTLEVVEKLFCRQCYFALKGLSVCL